MAFTDARIDPKVLLAPTTDSVRANLKTHFNTLHTNMTSVVVTDVGKSATGAEFIEIEERILELAERVAKACADHS